MTREIKINIDFENATDLIEANYPDEFPRQMPIWLKIDFSEDPVGIRAVTQNYKISGTPFHEWHGHEKVWKLPDAVDASRLHDWVEEDLLKHIKIAADGYESRWDGSNHVARYTEEAQEALDSIGRAVENMYLINDQGGLWDAGDWLDGVTYFPTEDKPWCDVDDYEIHSTTTDEELQQMADEIEENAKADGVVFDQMPIDYLQMCREKCQEVDDN